MAEKTEIITNPDGSKSLKTTTTTEAIETQTKDELQKLLDTVNMNIVRSNDALVIFEADKVKLETKIAQLDPPLPSVDPHPMDL